MTTPWPKTRPAPSVTALQRWVGEHARATGTTPDAVQRGLTAMVLAGMLGRVVDDQGNPVVLVKGGTHMLLRYGSSARPSKDFDVAVAQSVAELHRILREALSQPYLGFEATLAGPPEPIRDTGSLRAVVKLSYARKPWQSVKLEAATNEAPMGEVDLLQPSPDLSIFGFDTSVAVPCLPARYQIAQKIHAVTEVWDGDRDNDRFRDLLDLQLLATELERVGASAVRQACIEVFQRRGKQAWPPQVRSYPSWAEQYAAVARRVNLPVTDVDEAARAVTELIARIDAGDPEASQS